MKTKDFSYQLPEELIAQTPLKDRSSSRLMEVDRRTGEWVHHSFKEIFDLISPGDLLVFNDTKVIPARLIGQRENGGISEVLLLRDLGGDRWECLVRPGKKMKIGSTIDFQLGVRGTIEEHTEFGGRIIRFTYQGIWLELLEKIGKMPLPPYIHEKLEEQDRYQTVYANDPGSAAAPTAGLHFTPELLEEAEKRGIEMAFLTLHVGLGTFRPVQVENVFDHKMHCEYFSFSKKCGEKVRQAKKNGHRVIAVGTTSVRVLETVAQSGNYFSHEGWTDIFIYPGYQFQWVDALITNFHLPQSTLMMLVSALADREKILAAYEEAIRQRYRFFSFGDSMLII